MKYLFGVILVVLTILLASYLLKTECQPPEYKGSYTEECLTINKWKLLYWEITGNKIKLNQDSASNRH